MPDQEFSREIVEAIIYMLQLMIDYESYYTAQDEFQDMVYHMCGEDDNSDINTLI